MAEVTVSVQKVKRCMVMVRLGLGLRSIKWTAAS